MKIKNFVLLAGALLSQTNIAHAVCRGDTEITNPGTATYDGKKSEQMFQVTLQSNGSDPNTIHTRLAVENLDKPITPVKYINSKGYDALTFSFDYAVFEFQTDPANHVLVDKVQGNTRVSVISYDDCGNAVKNVIGQETFSGTSTAETNPPILANLRLQSPSRNTCRILGDVIDVDTGLDRVEIFRNGVSVGNANFNRGSASLTTGGPIPSKITSKFLLDLTHPCSSKTALYKAVAYDTQGNSAELSATLTAP